jgi:hypothetical protein
MAGATIEGLAFPSRPSREPGVAGRRGCLSEASSAAAEKGGEGTALKNLIGSEAIPNRMFIEPT